ncbi:hypothetical protein Dimus_014754 [Dionaea muscipula]
MCASAAAATYFPLLPKTLPLPCWRRHKCTVGPAISTLLSHSTGSSNPGIRFSSIIAQSSFEVSWLFPDENLPDDDDFGGWTIVNLPPFPKKKTGFPSFLIMGIGASIAVVLAAASYFAMARRGFKLPFVSQLHVFHDIWIPSAPEVTKRELGVSDASNRGSVTSEAAEVHLPVKYQPRIIPVDVDSTQEEALSVLKTLKIIEDDVKGGELCTRREYARWLVRANSSLERNPKHKINPSMALAGSLISAYDDVDPDDPDYEYIQALAEAGIVFSKMSLNYTMEEHGSINFYPDRFISRYDLIEWKARLEYDFASAGNGGVKDLVFLPVFLLTTILKEISLETTPGLFMDMLAGDRSLLSRVFGKIRRLQPEKPATKAQAAVALTGGKMTQVIYDVLLRIEAEEYSRKASKAEIKNELLNRGEMQRVWDEKMEQEKRRGLKAWEVYITALDELELEKNVQENALVKYWKEKSAIDCQRQLLNGLKMEVKEMSERLASEGAELIDDYETLRVVSDDLQVKREGILDAKSILEAEIEAVRILRSWIEDEARKKQASSKVLEEVGRRWRSDGPDACSDAGSSLNSRCLLKVLLLAGHCSLFLSWSLCGAIPLYLNTQVEDKQIILHQRPRKPDKVNNHLKGSA